MLDHKSENVDRFVSPRVTNSFFLLKNGVILRELGAFFFRRFKSRFVGDSNPDSIDEKDRRTTILPHDRISRDFREAYTEHSKRFPKDLIRTKGFCKDFTKPVHFLVFFTKSLRIPLNQYKIQ